MSIHQKTLLGICLVGLSGSAMAQEHPVKMEDLPAAVQATGVSDSTLTGRQWGFAPRIGIAWSPSFVKNVVVGLASASTMIGESFSASSRPVPAADSMA